MIVRHQTLAYTNYNNMPALPVLHRIIIGARHPFAQCKSSPVAAQGSAPNFWGGRPRLSAAVRGQRHASLLRHFGGSFRVTRGRVRQSPRHACGRSIPTVPTSRCAVPYQALRSTPVPAPNLTRQLRPLAAIVLRPSCQLAPRCCPAAPSCRDSCPTAPGRCQHLPHPSAWSPALAKPVPSSLADRPIGGR